MVKSDPPLRRTGRSLPIALLRARETVMAPIRVMLAKTGLSEQKWRLIRVLDENGPMEQTTLARESCLLLPSLTRIVKAMEQDGLVSRMGDPEDRRKQVVQVTDKGRQIIYDHADTSEAIAARWQAALGSEKYETLLNLLEELDTHQRR